MNWYLVVGVAVLLAALIMLFPRGTGKIARAVVQSFTPKPLNLAAFNEKFVAANKTLAHGNTEALKGGIVFLIESLDYAGEFTEGVMHAIRELRCALRHHDRADTKGPWNRDLSGYGVLSWKNDLYDRDAALARAWPHLESINNELKARGLGWNF